MIYARDDLCLALGGYLLVRDLRDEWSTKGLVTKMSKLSLPLFNPKLFLLPVLFCGIKKNPHKKSLSHKIVILYFYFIEHQHFISVHCKIFCFLKNNIYYQGITVDLGLECTSEIIHSNSYICKWEILFLEWLNAFPKGE